MLTICLACRYAQPTAGGLPRDPLAFVGTLLSSLRLRRWTIPTGYVDEDGFIQWPDRNVPRVASIHAIPSSTLLCQRCFCYPQDDACIGCTRRGLHDARLKLQEDSACHCLDLPFVLSKSLMTLVSSLLPP
jgi:hypothetical protein